LAGETNLDSRKHDSRPEPTATANDLLPPHSNPPPGPAVWPRPSPDYCRLCCAPGAAQQTVFLKEQSCIDKCTQKPLDRLVPDARVCCSCLPKLRPPDLPALARTTLAYAQVVQLARACTHTCFVTRNCFCSTTLLLVKHSRQRAHVCACTCMQMCGHA